MMNVVLFRGATTGKCSSVLQISACGKTKTHDLVSESVGELLFADASWVTLSRTSRKFLSQQCKLASSYTSLYEGK